MALESIKILRAEDLPAETISKEGLSQGFVKVRMERHSDPSPRFEQMTAKKAKKFWELIKTNKKECFE